MFKLACHLRKSSRRPMARAGVILLALAAVTAAVVPSVRVGATTGAVTEFTLPPTGGAPDGIAAGPDGNLWFADFNGNTIGRLTTGGVVTDFRVPTGGSGPSTITTGPDGNLWFSEDFGGHIGRITTGGVITEFSPPTPNSNPDFITGGPDGNVWFAESGANNIGRITPEGVITEFPVPTPGSAPQGIANGPDGNLWFTENVGDKVGRITPAGTITEFPLPSAGSHALGIAAGPDGNLWFTEQDPSANKIGRITLAGAVTEFTIPTAGSGPFDIVSGPDGNLWFTEQHVGGDPVGNKVGRITLAGAITEFVIPTVGGGPSGIAVGSDGNLWIAEIIANKVARLEVDVRVPTTTTVTSSQNPSLAGSPLTFTATVCTGPAMPTPPMGTMGFAVDGNPVAGTADLTSSSAPTGCAHAVSPLISSLAAGPHVITASYGGDPTHVASAGSLTQTVLGLEGGAFGERVSLTAPASINSGPTPTVTLPVGGGGPLTTSLAAVQVGGLMTVNTLKVGTEGGQASGGPFVSSSASVQRVTAAGGLIAVGPLSSTCRSTLAASSGSSSAASLVIAGRTVIMTNPGPNTTIVVAGFGSLILNEQARDSVGTLTVNALHLRLNGRSGAGDIILAQSRCGIDR
jgi:streptogramin lyase